MGYEYADEAMGDAEIVRFVQQLAKQVLSQLSYTPTVGTTFNSKVFAAFGKLRNTNFALYGVNP